MDKQAEEAMLQMCNEMLDDPDFPVGEKSYCREQRDYWAARIAADAKEA